MASPQPAKKLKLRLKRSRPSKLRGSDSEEDTIAVARQPRHNMSQGQLPVAVDAAHSELLSPSNDTTSELSSAPQSPEPRLIASKNDRTSRKEEYGDFMSYYIDGGSDEKPRGKVGIAVKPTSSVLPLHESPARKITGEKLQVDQESFTTEAFRKVTTNSRQPTVNGDSLPRAVPLPPFSDIRIDPQHNMAPHPSRPPGMGFSHPPAFFQSQTPTHLIPHRPINVPIPYVPPPKTDLPPVPLPVNGTSVEEKIRVLNELSAVLMKFNGAPAPETAFHESKRAQGDTHSPLNPSLVAFKNNDDGSTASAGNSIPIDIISQRLPSGYDHELAYGMLFICNALHSSASNRIHYNYTKILHQYQIALADFEASQPRGRGRPRKDSSPQGFYPPLAPSLDERGQYHLNGTLEGEAIDAFYAVFRSGVLQVNTIMKAPLAMALQSVYKQVDRMINRGEQDHLNRKEPHKYTSYSVQIKAHEEALAEARAKEAQAMHIAMQKQLANEEQMRRAMGMTSIWPLPNSGLPATMNAQVHFQQNPNLVLPPSMGSVVNPGFRHPNSMNPMPYLPSSNMPHVYGSVSNQPSLLRGDPSLHAIQHQAVNSNNENDPIYVSSSPQAKPRGTTAPSATQIIQPKTIKKSSKRAKGDASRRSFPAVQSGNEPNLTKGKVPDTLGKDSLRIVNTPASAGDVKVKSPKTKTKLKQRQQDTKDVIELSSDS